MNTPTYEERRFRDLFRFFDKVRDTGDCWQWQSAMHPAGYGVFSVEKKTISAHRWIYEQAVGPIPSGLDIDHLCRVRNCVRPDHLEPVTRLENVTRGLRGAGKTRTDHCAQGHPFDEQNSAYWGVIRPRRFCRACDRERRTI